MREFLDLREPYRPSVRLIINGVERQGAKNLIFTKHDPIFDGEFLGHQLFIPSDRPMTLHIEYSDLFYWLFEIDGEQGLYRQDLYEDLSLFFGVPKALLKAWGTTQGQFQLPQIHPTKDWRVVGVPYEDDVLLGIAEYDLIVDDYYNHNRLDVIPKLYRVFSHVETEIGILFRDQKEPHFVDPPDIRNMTYKNKRAVGIFGQLL